MSNQKSNKNTKIISLKRMSDIQRGAKISHSSDLQEQIGRLKEEISTLEETLKGLQDKKSKLMCDIQHAIEKEKNNWLETKEREREEAKKVGFKVGYDKGIEHAEKEWSEKITEVNQLVDTAKKDYYHTVEKHQKTILRLAIAAAEKVIKEKMTKNDAVFSTVIQHAILELKDKSHIAIYVHPNQYNFLMKQKMELEQLVEEDEILSIYINKNANEFDCTIKHPYGQIEAGIDDQLEQIKNTLSEIIAEES